MNATTLRYPQSPFPFVARMPEALEPACRVMFTFDATHGVDLRLQARGSTYRVCGQVLGPEEPGAVELASDVDGSRLAHVAPLDGGGEFHIHGVRPGRYVLTLHLLDDDVELPPFDIGF